MKSLRIKDLFSQIDADGTGSVNIDTVPSILQQLELDEKVIESILSKCKETITQEELIELVKGEIHFDDEDENEEDPDTIEKIQDYLRLLNE